MNCRKCKGGMQSASAESIEGAQGDVTVTLLDFPYLVCPQCRSKAFVDAEFPSSVLFQLTEGLPKATAKRLMGKGVFCGGCGTALDTTQQQVEEFGVPLALEGGQSLRALARLPAVRCRGCNRVQVAGNAPARDSEIADALIAAFETVGPLNR